MATYLLTLSYDGTYFKGWQTQKKHGLSRERTVQNVVEKVLKTFPSYQGNLTAASRTDAGVHALGQTVSFTLKNNMKMGSDPIFLKRLISLLPEDIVPLSIKKVSNKFNARFQAQKKEYIYTIFNSSQRPLFERKYVWWRKASLNLKAMRKALYYFKGKHDFKAFESSGSPRQDTHCVITDISAVRKNNLICIRIVGNRFLYNMVRNMVGALAEVGRGKQKPTYIKTLLEHPTQRKAGPKAPAHGLTLYKVYYQKA